MSAHCPTCGYEITLGGCKCWPWTKPKATGWICPACHKGNAPHADKCGHCAEGAIHIDWESLRRDGPRAHLATPEEIAADKTIIGPPDPFHNKTIRPPDNT